MSLPRPKYVGDASASRVNILGLSRAALEAEVTALGLPKFRSRQLWRWVWRHGLTSFDEMSDLAKPVATNLLNYSLRTGQRYHGACNQLMEP